MPKTPQTGSLECFAAFEKMALALSRSPSITLILEDRLIRACADGDELFRVTASMLKDVDCGEVSNASISALPCLPVAPVTSKVFCEAIVSNVVEKVNKYFSLMVEIKSIKSSQGIGAHRKVLIKEVCMTDRNWTQRGFYTSCHL